MAKPALQIGDPAPDFELTADDGSRVKLSAFRSRRVAVYFYPKDDTPGCTTQACGFRDRYRTRWWMKATGRLRPMGCGETVPTSAVISSSMKTAV